MELSTNYLSQEDFLYDWDQWKNTLNRATKTTDKIGMPDESMEIVSAKVSEFLSERLYLESKEEALIKGLWSVANPDERKILVELLFRIMDQGAYDFKDQEPDEPYGGY